MPSKIKAFFKNLGPGLVTGASDDDPSGVATYSQAGAGFGLATLWTALITFPLMAAIQEMCARIGTVTSSGLPGTLKAHYPKWVLYALLVITVPAIVLNIGADIQSMGAVTHLIIPAIPDFVFSIFFTALLIFVIVRFDYDRIASILKWLCLVLLLYL
ncbi:divalent metal cation transporter, partial [Mucilaginibacter corticis]